METKEQRQERKDLYLLQVFRNSKGVEDVETLLEEEAIKWEEKNK